MKFMITHYQIGVLNVMFKKYRIKFDLIIINPYQLQMS